MTAKPERMVRWLLVLSVLGSVYRDYWLYSGVDKSGVEGYLDLAHGRGLAPFQYRVGVVKIGAWLYEHHHVPFRYSFTALDLLCLLVAVMVSYQLLLRSAIYRRADSAMRWFGSAAFVALALYLMSWLSWYKKVETDPSAALVLLMLWLWSANAPQDKPAGTAGRVWTTALGLIVVTVAQSLLRAEMAMMLSAGIFVVAAWKKQAEFSLPRVTAMAVAFLCMTIAATTQLLMMKVVYPNAHYQDNAVWMFLFNIVRPHELMCFLIFVLPAAWTLRQVWQRKFLGDSAAVGFLMGAIPFVVLWAMIGRTEEVRIFLPIALALTPLTVQMAILLAEGSLAEPARTR